jgi:hypothetical protein
MFGLATFIQVLVVASTRVSVEVCILVLAVEPTRASEVGFMQESVVVCTLVSEAASILELVVVYTQASVAVFTPE